MYIHFFSCRIVHRRCGCRCGKKKEFSALKQQHQQQPKKKK